MPRLGYTKTRTGCIKCRQRKVKCDEKRPCSACARHGVSCSLTLRASPTEQTVAGTVTDDRSSVDDSEPLDSETLALLAYFTPATHELPSEVQGTSSHGSPSKDLSANASKAPWQKKAWVTDLELMHHWSTAAYLALPRGDELGHIWQGEVAKLAFSNDALLHQLLAISASHLAYLRPTQRHEYSLVASQHQSEAAKALRAGLTNITAENCDALFAAASLLLIGAFAALAVHQGEDGSRPTLEDMIGIFMLARGMVAVVKTSQSVIREGPLADMFRDAMHTTPVVFLDAVRDKLHQLKVLLSEYEIDPVTSVIVDFAISNLVDGIEAAAESTSAPELRVTITWAVDLAEDFITLLRRRNPVALTVFAYYCAVLHRAGQSAWFTAGWGRGVAQDLEKDVPSPWKEAIQWPLRCMHDGAVAESS